jgi:hypothetical protein
MLPFRRLWSQDSGPLLFWLEVSGDALKDFGSVEQFGFRNFDSGFSDSGGCVLGQ